MNYIIMTDGEGNAKHIDHDVSVNEISELAQLFDEHLQKASTNVTLSSACATDFVSALTKLIARITECKEV